jgi:hypothetical protein
MLHWTECLVCETETEVETAEHRACKCSIAKPGGSFERNGCTSNDGHMVSACSLFSETNV